MNSMQNRFLLFSGAMERRPGEGGSAGQKHGDIYINTEYSGLRNKKSIFHPAQSSGESLRTSSAGTGGDGWSRPEIETRPSDLSSVCHEL